MVTTDFRNPFVLHQLLLLSFSLASVVPSNVPQVVHISIPVGHLFPSSNYQYSRSKPRWMPSSRPRYQSQDPDAIFDLGAYLRGTCDVLGDLIVHYFIATTTNVLLHGWSYYTTQFANFEAPATFQVNAKIAISRVLFCRGNSSNRTFRVWILYQFVFSSCKLACSLR